MMPLYSIISVAIVYESIYRCAIKLSPMCNRSYTSWYMIVYITSNLKPFTWKTDAHSRSKTHLENLNQYFDLTYIYLYKFQLTEKVLM